MTFGIRTWSDTRHMTLSENAKTIRKTVVLYVPSGQTGSILLSDLPSGRDGAYFIPVSGNVSEGIQPYTWIANNRLNWRGSVGDMYLCVMSDNQ